MQIKILIETERLYLREMNLDDAENAYLLNLDPDVIKYTGDNAFESIEAAKQFLKQYEHYSKYGFGRWAVINKTNGEFLGWCGLKYTPENDEYDIGYRFFKKHWNKGYATEAAKACIKIGFERFNMKEIVGRAMKENLASIKVLQKTGLQYWKEYEEGNDKGVVYKIEKNKGNGN